MGRDGHPQTDYEALAGKPVPHRAQCSVGANVSLEHNEYQLELGL